MKTGLDDPFEVSCPHLSLQLLYLPSTSFPQFPNMFPASLTFLKHISGAGRPSSGQKTENVDKLNIDFHWTRSKHHKSANVDTWWRPDGVL